MMDINAALQQTASQTLIYFLGTIHLLVSKSISMFENQLFLDYIIAKTDVWHLINWATHDL